MGPSTISLPERLDGASVERMRAELAAAARSDAIVLEGRAGIFCLGMEFARITESEPGARQRGLESFAALLEQLLLAPRPTLAVVDGAALGGGLGLAAACDVVLASDRSQFGLPEALYGLAPAIIRPALMTRLSVQGLNKLLFTCHARNVDEASALGLVDRVVSPHALEPARREILRQFRRAQSGTVATARHWNAAGFAAALKEGVAETGAALSDKKVIAALRAAETGEELPWSR